LLDISDWQTGVACFYTCSEGRLGADVFHRERGHGLIKSIELRVLSKD